MAALDLRLPTFVCDAVSHKRGLASLLHVVGDQAATDLRSEIDERVSRGDLDATTLALADRLAELRPADVFPRVIAARCLEASGQLDKALTLLDRVLSDHPTSSVADNRRADILRQRAARERAEGILAQRGDRLLAAANEAKAAERDIDFQVEARRLLARRDDTPTAHCALGAALRHRRNHDAALQAYAAARQLDNSVRTNSMAWVGLAATKRDLRRLAEAEQLAREVLVDQPKEPHARAVLAAICMDDFETRNDTARLDEAEELIQPLRGDVYFSLRGRLEKLRSTMSRPG